MQGVAELVQEGLYLVGGEQRRLVGGGLGEVHHNLHQGTRVGAVGLAPLLLEVCHPGTGALACAGEEVGVEHADEFAVGVGDVKGFCVGVVCLHAGVGGELQAVEASGQAEDTVDYLVKLEVGAQGLLVEGVLRGLVLVAVVAVVPGLERHGMTLDF